MSYELPHQLDRQYQLETAKKIVESDKKYILVVAPTGSGKSAYAAYVSQFHKTTVLVKEKSLQAQYADQYGFDVLMGKVEYKCKNYAEILPAPEDASLCISTAKSLDLCGAYCEYPKALAMAKASQRVVINYAKYFTQKEWYTDYLFLDECHQLPDVVTERSGLTIDLNNQIFDGFDTGIDFDSISVPAELAINGLAFPLLIDISTHIFRQKYDVLETRGKKQRIRFNQRIDRLIRKINYILINLTGDWFVKKEQSKMVIKPLSAKWNFKPMFEADNKIVMMTATPGNVNALLSDLGLSLTEVEIITVPNTFKASDRPIYDLQAPKIGYKASPDDYAQQAKMIGDIVAIHPTEWTGIIHTRSKKQAKDLAYRLGSNYILMPDYLSPKEAVAHWSHIRKPGLKIVTWNFWEGVDMGLDQITIVAKVPFGFLGDDFEKARMNYSHSMYNQRAAQSLIQALGRTRRGHIEHYGPGAGLVAIADGNWTRIQNFISPDIFEAIVTPVKNKAGDLTEVKRTVKITPWYIGHKNIYCPERARSLK